MISTAIMETISEELRIEQRKIFY